MLSNPNVEEQQPLWEIIKIYFDFIDLHTFALINSIFPFLHPTGSTKLVELPGHQ